MTIEVAKWVEDSYGCFNLHHAGVHAFIQKRPVYCDRGHYSFNVEGIPYVDGADSFPRYYMSLRVALREATTWLNWRLYKIPLSADEALITLHRIDGSVIDVA